ncbi:cobalamin B12-binding domain-containing protein [Salisediminibacterium halotolerans]|uniref:cobalamin B12-binding domain-containing protein n=1 Tax=Salisediminibacterium halotolerans TaxID=517425 RepID=UPI000EAFE679|nr:cobalamin-dependent protein [Salisediminibacterium halotolerans]RLJ71738.1 methanogenic corrinoid protein MtbC1 [Actinophytocola xinjiangensis]RPE86888.1 methanogenic corrinoid protein MtbC1 [Salisediminibacterium halotolerans]TWG32951.1 methanogenic corrinoid protein MtbC1 [Salisediminibacterium halotolerans]GEL09209.1 hypothetical protein SHA02_26250 [Salisediminibacterium halotolerans]
MPITPEQLAHLFLEGKEDEAFDAVKAYQETYSEIEMLEEFITPAMYEVGFLWEANKISVADEHLATGICDFVLTAAVKPRAKTNSSGKTIVLFGAENEEHYLGLKMVAAVFRVNGWQVYNMGPNMPIADAIAGVKRWEPDVVGVSTGFAPNEERTERYLNRLMAASPKTEIILGGRYSRLHRKFEQDSRQVTVIDRLENVNSWLRQDEKGVRHATS